MHHGSAKIRRKEAPDTDDELSAMSDAIKEMSTEIPATTEELAAIAESAGQLGIHKESLL